MGIQASTIGTYDIQLRDTGFHRPTDNKDRVVMERLPESMDILVAFIEHFENKSNANSS